MKNDFKSKNNVFQTTEEEIDLKKILNILLRNKYLIVFLTIFLFVFSGIYSVSKKKIWEGQFEIVVKEQQNASLGQSLIGGSSILDNLILGGTPSNLNTEVGILQSSSVLMPVFEFYKKERLKLNPKSEEISFSSWKNKLDVSLKKTTSIVEIAYRDIDKSLINKVLEKTIDIYQEYSGKSKKRDLQLANNYLAEQIEFYKNKSSQSMKLVQEYAMDQDLTILDYGLNSRNRITNFLPDFGRSMPNFVTGNANPDLLGENVNIEIARVKAANQIRNIKIKIKKIESLKDDDDIDKLSYINMTIPELRISDTFDKLAELDLEILDLKSKYTDQFPEIDRLYEKRKLLIGYLKDKSIGFLKAKKVSAEAILESATRPKEVLLKYKELVREANRDDTTLVELENRLRSINLLQARLEDPWELITSPTIKTTPVNGNSLFITFIGSLTGFFLGFIISILKEKKTGLIFEEDILESSLNTKIIDKIDLNKLNSKSNINKFFITEIFNQNKDKSFKFFYSNYLNKLDQESLRLIFENKKNNSSIISDFVDLQDNELIIFVSTIPEITFKEVNRIKSQMEILGKEFYGIVIINN